MAKKGGRDPISLDDIRIGLPPPEEIEQMRRWMQEHAQENTIEPRPYRANEPLTIRFANNDIDWNRAYSTGSTNVGPDWSVRYEEQGRPAPTPAPTERFWLIYTEHGQVFSTELSLTEAIEHAQRTMGNNKKSYIMECKGWVERDGDETRYIQAPPPKETGEEPPTSKDEEIPF